MVPFESLVAVSYLPSIVTMAVSVAVCEIFSVQKWCVDPQAAANRRIRRIFVLRRKSAEKNSSSAVSR